MTHQRSGPSRVGYASYLSGTLDYRESEPLAPDRLDALVTRLRGGDGSVAEEIIKGHYRMVAAIVGDRVRSKRRLDDVMGAALLALTESVHNAATALYNNNITYYITSNVKYAIKDEIANCHVLRMPGRTIRHRIARGELFDDIVPGDGVILAEDVTDRGSGDADGEGPLSHRRRHGECRYALPFHIPASKPLCESPEFKEAIARATTNPTEQAIVALRAQGFTYAEIGVKVGLSTPRIGQIMPGIEARFDAYYKV